MLTNVITIMNPGAHNREPDLHRQWHLWMDVTCPFAHRLHHHPKENESKMGCLAGVGIGLGLVQCRTDASNNHRGDYNVIYRGFMDWFIHTGFHRDSLDVP
jgi:hypothetical protein